MKNIINSKHLYIVILDRLLRNGNKFDKRETPKE